VEKLVWLAKPPNLNPYWWHLRGIKSLQPEERKLSGRINFPLTPMVLKLNFQQAHTGVEFAVHTFLAL